MATEKRLIDVNKVIDQMQQCIDESPYERDSIASYTFGAIIECLKKEPTVDAVEVVHGRWVWDVESHGDPMYGIDEDYGYRCSECQVWASEYGVDGDIYDEPPTHMLHYCPNCGADMRGDGNA